MAFRPGSGGNTGGTGAIGGIRGGERHLSSAAVRSWEAERHQMRLRSVQVLQQILTDPEGEPSFRQIGLTLELPDPDSSEPPGPDHEPAPPEPLRSAPSGLGQRLRRLFGRAPTDEAPRRPQ